MNKKDLINILTLIAIPLFISGLTISLIFAIIYGNFNINIHPMSDLGSINCTPYPIVMNLTLILSSIILLFYFYKLYEIVIEVAKSKKLYYISSCVGFILIAIMIVSLFITGIINVDISRDIHNVCTIFVFVPLIFGEIIIGLIIIALGINIQRYISILMAFGHLTISFLYFLIDTPLLQWMFFSILISWGIPLSIRMIKI